MRKNELSYKSLKNICNPNNFKFETTDDLDSKDLIFDQEGEVMAEWKDQRVLHAIN